MRSPPIAADLARAERWLRCAERHYRLKEHARRDAEERQIHKSKVDRVHAEADHRDEQERKFARQVRAAQHRKRLKAIEDGGAADANGSHTAGRGTGPFPHDREG